MLLRSRSLSLSSLRDRLKYLRSQVNVPVIFFKGSLGALSMYWNRLLHICRLLNSCDSFVTWIIAMTLLVYTITRSCTRWPTIYSIIWMYRMSGIFHRKHHIEFCYNHGDPDHGVPKCPKPINQNWINKAVGTLKDGCICNVPLPRVPQIQSASPMTSHESIAPKAWINLASYLHVPSWIPTLPKLGSILGFSQRLLWTFPPIAIKAKNNLLS